MGCPTVPVPVPASAARSASACEPYREFIEDRLGRGRNAMAIYQDLVSFHGFDGAVRQRPPLRAQAARAAAPEARAVIVSRRLVRRRRSTTARARWCAIRTTGTYRRIRLFVLTLGCSRKSVRLLTRKSSTRIWVELHRASLPSTRWHARKSWCSTICARACSSPTSTIRTLNPLYRDLLAHYGAVALPCRVRDPDRKGKVESAVGHAKRTPLKGLRFEAMEPAQSYLDHWEDPLGRHAHPRHHQAPGRGDVRRGEAPPPAAAARTVSLL